MTIGLPLLIVLDERAVRAVIAHEVAHAALQHTSGAVNLNEFIAAAENIFEYADPETTITGRIAAALLNALVGWLCKEYQVLSYLNELSADRQSAECVGCHEAARALVLTHAMSARMDEIVFTPLEMELLGAIRAPTPPLQRIFSRLDMIRLPDQIQAAALAAMAHEGDSASMHPPLRKRLANLGFSEIPKIDPVERSAVDTLLSDHAVKDIVARFDNQWSKRATEQVDIYQ
jgi:Zn-dependent protease with chaperone function